MDEIVTRAGQIGGVAGADLPIHFAAVVLSAALVVLVARAIGQVGKGLG